MTLPVRDERGPRTHHLAGTCDVLAWSLEAGLSDTMPFVLLAT